MYLDILLNQEKVGSATVIRRGLYWCFDCWCALPGLCFLEVCSKHGRERLGIPVPEGGRFHLKKQIPVSRLGDGAMTIAAVRKGSGRFVPVDPEKPFTALSELSQGTYQQRDGQPGVLIGG